MKSLGGACILDLESGKIRTRHDYKPIAWSTTDIRRLYEMTEPGGVGTQVEEATFGIAVGDEEYPMEEEDDAKLRYNAGSNHS